MILANGRLMPESQTAQAVEQMQDEICNTLDQSALNSMLVVAACDKLSGKVKRGEYDTLIESLVQAAVVTRGQIEAAALHMSREALLYKLQTELQDLDEQVTPPFAHGTCRRRAPLGVLLHIAAGNMDALPAYSCIEGLLAGNINIIKLPDADNGLSVMLLGELVKCESALAPYIYVFDTPSSDAQTLFALAGLADGIIVWGGDEAISGIRRLAPTGAKLIEWGHKRSFAYATPEGASEDGLQGLAGHIFETNQVLCSSCQGVYYDTDSAEELEAFAQRLFKILEEVGREKYNAPSVMRARQTLSLRTLKLEGKKLLQGDYSSVIIDQDSQPETSLMFGSVWVKPLRREKIVKTLFNHRRYMQTVGLLCAESEKKEIADIFSRAGVVRITTASSMSRSFAGEAHDGEYPLLRYTKIIETD